MNRIAVASAQSFASTNSAFGPCSAISARSASDSIDAGLRKMRAQMRLVLGLAGGVDHQEQMVAEIRHHQIVQNAAIGIGELRVALPPGATATMSCGTSRSSASAASSTFPDFGSKASWPICETSNRPAGFACAGVPSARRLRIVPAFHSRRTEPSCRRAPHGARARVCVVREIRRAPASRDPPGFGDQSPKTQRKPHLSLCLRVLSRRRTPLGPKTLRRLFPDASPSRGPFA